MKKLMMGLLLIGSVAFAGPAEREKKKEVEPVIATARADWKKNCGCDLNIDVKWDTFKVDHMSMAKRIAESISESVAKACADKEAKVAMCKMKKLEITTGGNDFKFAGSTGTCLIDGNSYIPFDMIQSALDK
jgi:hypothetical protein